MIIHDIFFIVFFLCFIFICCWSRSMSCFTVGVLYSWYSKDTAVSSVEFFPTSVLEPALLKIIYIQLGHDQIFLTVLCDRHRVSEPTLWALCITSSLVQQVLLVLTLLAWLLVLELSLASPDCRPPRLPLVPLQQWWCFFLLTNFSFVFSYCLCAYCSTNAIECNLW